MADQTEKRIIKQIEYYFGDLNLLKDKFLKEKVKEDDGWVTIETMLNFNRLKSITEDPQVVLAAIKKSESGLMEVNEEGEAKIRRNPERPLPTDTKAVKEDLLSRSVYAKSFPLDATLDDLELFFEKYGPVDNVYMKKDFSKKTFKGSLFVVFQKKEDMEKFLAEEGTKYNDVELTVKLPKAEYHEKKIAERKAEKEAREAKAVRAAQLEARNNPPPIPEMSNDEEDDRVRSQMTKGSVMKIQEMNTEQNSRDSVKEFFTKHGADVAWIDFDQGMPEGYIRLREANTAYAVLESMKEASEEGAIMLHDKKVVITVVEGEEEFTYWKKMFRDIYERNRKGRENRRRKEGGQEKMGRRKRLPRQF